MARNGQVGDFELSYEKNELEQPHELQNGYELTYELPNQDEPDEDADRDPCDVMALPVCRSGRKGHKFRSCFKSAMDGFEGSDLEAVFNQIRKFARKGRGLTNIFSFGGFDELESKRFHDRKHRFHRINPDSGRVVGAIAGNFLFRFGGRHNRLSDTGKIVLDNMMSGKYRRKMHRFEPVVKPEDKEKLQKVKPPRPPPPTPIAVPDLSDFERQRKRCLAEKSLFEDPDFPANNKSLFNSRPTRNIIWKRPGEIVPDPQLIVGDKSRFDVKQGLLGNCWLLAAIANLTLHDELFYRVVPPDQHGKNLWKKDLTDNDKRAIVVVVKNGLTMMTLAGMFGVTEAVISQFLKRQKAQDGSTNSQRTGRPRVTDRNDDRNILKTSRTNPRLTAPAIRREVFLNSPAPPSVSTVKRRLNAAGIMGRRPVKKPLISEKNRVARVKWAKEHLNWTRQDWNKILSSDEIKFLLFGSDGIQ
ncbi:unnamed protein product [Caenorhabditis auriculariae]|uniref:Calpain catalytic domain-containing protein n=1 Tax=Caenorhabditis auriculariae TaxID=2777116 RepID=A0A8S1HPY4_9PELO|nr:unnamed protein product [Caenorhabditis auriculariae]